MTGTIENAHNKFIEKIDIAQNVAELIIKCCEIITRFTESKLGKKYRDILKVTKKIAAQNFGNELRLLEQNYNLLAMPILSDYYCDPRSESRATKKYYRAITSENVVALCDEIVSKMAKYCEIIFRIFGSDIGSDAEMKEHSNILNLLAEKINCAKNVTIDITIDQCDYDLCKCGSRMSIIPEISELHCECGRTRTMIGTACREEKTYSQEYQKAKHNGYDTSRHYKFWIERLQAIESKQFEKEDLANIEYVIKRDNYDQKTLNCEQMRKILKDPKVAATSLNNHTPLLVKKFGGPAPPQLNFQENKILSTRFNKVMTLYCKVVPEGGNKRYYPFFIYKLLQFLFKDVPDKLRLLNYIHLQSRETIIKNDNIYREIAKLADPDDGIVYVATDPDRKTY